MDFDRAFMVHSLSYEESMIVVDAKKKIADYIRYRQNRDREIIDIVKVRLMPL